MANYTSKEDVEKMVGYNITDDETSRPSIIELNLFLIIADALINSALRQETNITDTYGLCRAYELGLVYAEINNLFAISDPDNYAPMEVDLTLDQEIKLRRTYGLWDADTFDVGE